MERNYLICLLVGRIVNQDQSVTGEDLRYQIDQQLEKCCLSLLGQEKGDDQLLEELTGELMIYVMGQGINRKQRRSHS